MEKTHCLNCGTALKVGLMSSVTSLTDKEVTLVNQYRDNPKNGYCTKCIGDGLKLAKESCKKELTELKKFIKSEIDNILIVTLNPPDDWDFEVVDMLTAQTVVGTGLMSDFSSDWNDLFGSRSNTLSAKLKSGEDFCKIQLRIQCLELDCHAIVSVDIDYSEVGTTKGMLMVCMAGTAIRFKSSKILGAEKYADIENLIKCNERVRYLEDLMLFR